MSQTPPPNGILIDLPVFAQLTCVHNTHARTHTQRQTDTQTCVKSVAIGRILCTARRRCDLTTQRPYLMSSKLYREIFELVICDQQALQFA